PVSTSTRSAHAAVPVLIRAATDLTRCDRRAGDLRETLSGGVWARLLVRCARHAPPDSLSRFAHPGCGEGRAAQGLDQRPGDARRGQAVLDRQLRLVHERQDGRHRRRQGTLRADRHEPHGRRQQRRRALTILAGTTIVYNGCVMSSTRNALVLAGAVPVGTKLTVEGWVRTRRDSKAGLSFLAVHDGSCFDPIQVVAPADLPNYESDVLRITTGCAVRVTG